MQDVLTKITDTLSAVRVMQRSGLIPFPRVDEGVRVLLAVDKYGPFAGSVHAHAAAGHGRIALIDERGALTYRELEAQSNALARAWKTEGIGVGTCVGAMCRNHRGLILTMLAAAKSGVRLVLMNTGFARPQLVDVAVREKVEFFVFDSEFADIADALPSDVATYLSWVDEPVRTPRPRHRRAPSTTSSPDSPPTPCPPPNSPASSSCSRAAPPAPPKARPGHTSPFVTAQFLDPDSLASQADHADGRSRVPRHRHLPTRPGHGAREHRRDAASVRPGDHGAPDRRAPRRHPRAGADDAAENHRSRPRRARQVRHVVTEGHLRGRIGHTPGPVHPHPGGVRQGAAQLLRLTEVAAVTVATPDDLERAPGTAGRPPATCHIALFDDAGKRITEPEVVGRIFAKSGLSFEGYTDGHDKERIDGMLSTGDVGHFDHDGLLFVDGRDDDMIVSGGENVYPLEVENLIAERPDVLEVAVIGVEDDEFGHRLRAFVVAASTSSRDPDEIRAHVKSNLARYKVPRDVVFIEELPRNATGKLLRRVLSEMDVESS